MQDLILTQKSLPWQVDHWQKLLSSSVRPLDDLFDRLDLSINDRVAAAKADELFRTRVPKPFMEKAQKNDPNDPLLRQFVPSEEELQDQSGFVLDPLVETKSQPIPGLLHKYQGRVLILMTNICAIHCRYCFRRHFPYDENRLSAKEWDDLCAYIAADNSVEEVILSGGDPLSLKTEQLRNKLNPILKIPHIKRLRIHTRFPVVIPERIDDKFLDWLGGVRQEKVMVVHANHPAELDERFSIAMNALRNNKVLLLNQSVLLKGVNDNVEALVLLSQKLFESGVMPYYLHLLDRVKGAAHFDLSEIQSNKIYQELLARLPGYMVPKLVREVAGKPSKVMAF